MAAPRLLAFLCCLFLGGVSAADGNNADTAKLLAHVNDLTGPSNHGHKTQRSIYRDDYPPRYVDGLGGHGSSFPFEMRPPFAAAPHSSGRQHPLNDVFDHPDYRPAVKYAPSYKYQKPPHYPTYSKPTVEHYSPPVYVPRGHRERRPSSVAHPDPFLTGHQKVHAQFESEHAPPPAHSRYPPLPAVHRVPLPPVYHAPPPYAHEFPYSEPEPEHRPAPRRPHAKALDSLNPTQFIATIATAYHENEKNFGVHRQGKLATHTPEHAPPHPGPLYRQHAGYAPLVPEHRVPHVPEYRAPHVPEYQAPHVPEYRAPHVPEYQAPHVPEYRAPHVPEYWAPHVRLPSTEHVPYLELGPLYSLAAAGSHVSTAVDTSTVDGAEQASTEGEAAGGPDAGQEA